MNSLPALNLRYLVTICTISSILTLNSWYQYEYCYYLLPAPLYKKYLIKILLTNFLVAFFHFESNVFNEQENIRSILSYCNSSKKSLTLFLLKLFVFKRLNILIQTVLKGSRKLAEFVRKNVSVIATLNKAVFTLRRLSL